MPVNKTEVSRYKKAKPEVEEAKPKAKKVKAVDNSTPQIRGEHLIVPVGKIRPTASNYNKQSDFIYEKLKKSIKEVGFVDPIIVRDGDGTKKFGYYEIIGGEHRHRGATDCGMKEIPVINLGDVTDVKAKKLLIILNETKGRPDNDALAALVTEIGKEGIGELDSIPFTDEEVESMTSMANFDFDTGSSDIEVDDTEVTNEEGDEEEYEGLQEVLKVHEISEATDQALAKRLKAFMLVESCPSSRPWQSIVKLLDFFYENSGKKEPELNISDEDSEPEDEEIIQTPKKKKTKS